MLAYLWQYLWQKLLDPIVNVALRLLLSATPVAINAPTDSYSIGTMRYRSLCKLACYTY